MFGYLEVLFVVGPVIGLLVVGLLIALRSGLGEMASRKDLGMFVSNLTWTLFRLVGYVAGMVAVQQIVGFRMHVGW